MIGARSRCVTGAAARADMRRAAAPAVRPRNCMVRPSAVLARRGEPSSRLARFGGATRASTIVACGVAHRSGGSRGAPRYRGVGLGRSATMSGEAYGGAIDGCRVLATSCRGDRHRCGGDRVRGAASASLGWRRCCRPEVPAMRLLLRGTDLVGLPVVTLAGDDIAEVRDVPFDADAGRRRPPHLN